MGKHFGNLQKLSGVIYYCVSPHEVKPFSGILNPGIKNTIRRFRETFLWVAIPVGLVYATVDLVAKEYQNSLRKNPADYVDDV